jgi:hypothetical protein
VVLARLREMQREPKDIDDGVGVLRQRAQRLIGQRKGKEPVAVTHPNIICARRSSAGGVLTTGSG